MRSYQRFDEPPVRGGSQMLPQPQHASTVQSHVPLPVQPHLSLWKDFDAGGIGDKVSDRDPKVDNKHVDEY